MEVHDESHAALRMAMRQETRWRTGVGFISAEISAFYSMASKMLEIAHLVLLENKMAIWTLN